MGPLFDDLLNSHRGSASDLSAIERRLPEILGEDPVEEIDNLRTLADDQHEAITRYAYNIVHANHAF
jgi:hypothetical protein